MSLLSIFLFFSAFINVAKSAAATSICVANQQSECPNSINARFINSANFKASDVYIDGTVDLYVYANLDGVKIEAKSLKGELNVFGNKVSLNGAIKLEFSFLFRPSNAINIHDVAVKVVGDTIYASKVFFDNVKLACDKASDKLKIVVGDLKSDAKSLIEAINIDTTKFSLTQLQKDLAADINVDISFSLTTDSIVDIFGDVSEGIKAILKRREINLINTEKGSSNHVVKISSILALPKVNFQNIKKSVEIAKEGFLNAIEMFQFNFDLEGGKLTFPVDKWPYALTLQSFFSNSVFEIIQNVSSIIEIGAQNLPAEIKNIGSQPLDIKALALKCGITGSLYINNTLDKIRTDLEGKLDFAVNSIEKLSDAAKLISNKAMQLLSEIEPKLDALSEQIRNIVDKLEVKYDQIKKNIFNLADNGHLAIQFKFDLDGTFASGSIIFDAAIVRDSNGKFTLDLDGGIIGELNDYPFEKLKQFIGKPQNLVCSKVKVNVGDWILNVVSESFDDIIKLQYGTDDAGLHCLQFVLQRLPDFLSEKYCVGTKCPAGYTQITKDSLVQLKDKIDQRTKSIALNIKEAILSTNSLDFSAFGGNVNFSIDADKNGLYIDLDLKIKDHLLSLDVSKAKLNFLVKNEEKNNYLEVNVPYLSLKDLTFEGQFKDKKLAFTGEQVSTDLQTFRQIANSKFNSLILDLENSLIGSITKIVIGDDKMDFRNIISSSAVMKPSQVEGDLTIKFATSELSTLDLNLEANIKATKGFKLDVVNKLGFFGASTINFAKEWANVVEVGKGITVAHQSDLKLTNVPENIGLNLEGSGNVEISLMAGVSTLKLSKELELTGSVNFKVNGKTVFGDLHFSGTVNFKYASSVSNSGLLAEDKAVYVETATCNKNSKVVVEKLIVGEKLVLETGSSLNAQTIEVTNKPVVVKYLFNQMPKIETTSSAMTKPSSIKLQYQISANANNDAKEVNYNEYVGYSQDIYCSSNATFNEATCKDYAKLVSFESDFAGLNGDSSAIRAACLTMPVSENDMNNFKTCLVAVLNEVPSLDLAQTKKKSNTGLIVGVTIAAVVIVIAIVVAVLVIIKKKGNSRSSGTKDISLQA